MKKSSMHLQFLTSCTSTKVDIAFFICDSEGNKIYISELIPVKIDTQKIICPWTLNTDLIELKETEKYFCYFTIYGDSFYNPEEVWLEL